MKGKLEAELRETEERSKTLLSESSQRQDARLSDMREKQISNQASHDYHCYSTPAHHAVDSWYV